MSEACVSNFNAVRVLEGKLRLKLAMNRLTRVNFNSIYFEIQKKTKATSDWTPTY